MRYAEPHELREIYSIFASRKDIFPHVRQDAIQRRIAARQCIFEDGVVVTFQKYRKRTRVGDVDIPAGAVMLHQLVNSRQFNGAGSRVFLRFVMEVVSGGELYLSVRAENQGACSFYEKHGMECVGYISWSNGTIPGRVYRYVTL